MLRRVAHYDADMRVLGARDPRETARVALPSYADPGFLGLVRDLVAKLSPLDGNPGIAELRLGAGLTTEDNPSPGGARWLMAGYTDRDWLRYCRRLLDIYHAAFHRTRIEFDVGFTGLAAARGAAQEADALVDAMIDDRVFLAFDGLSDRTAADVTASGAPRDWLARDVGYLRRARRAGLQVGLEARAPLTAPDLHDVPSLVAAVETLGADRLVLFPFEAAVLAGGNDSKSPMVAAARLWIASQPNSEDFPDHTRALVEALRTGRH